MTYNTISSSFYLDLLTDSVADSTFAWGAALGAYLMGWKITIPLVSFAIANIGAVASLRLIQAYSEHEFIYLERFTFTYYRYVNHYLSNPALAGWLALITGLALSYICPIAACLSLFALGWLYSINKEMQVYAWRQKNYPTTLP